MRSMQNKLLHTLAAAACPFLPVLLFLSLCGCGDGQTLVVVTVSGVTSDVTLIGADAILNGNKEKNPEIYSGNISDFGLKLPAGASGVLQVALFGFNQQTCGVSSGAAETTLAGQDRVDLSVSLQYLAMPDCSPN